MKLSEKILYLPNPYDEGELDECIEQAKHLEAENEALRELFWMTLYYWMGPEFGPMPTDEDMYNKIAATHALLTDKQFTGGTTPTYFSGHGRPELADEEDTSISDTPVSP